MEIVPFITLIELKIMEKVDFKEIAKFVCFNIFAKSLPTPNEFESLPEDVKLSVYVSSWRQIIDACNCISSALSIDRLQDCYIKDGEK